MFKSGFISILGMPNVGKSTLINTLIKRKISIISHKPNITLNKVIGICNENNAQLIFIDTPGFNKNKKFLLNKRMNNVSLEIMKDVDIILFLVTDVLNVFEKQILNTIYKNKKQNKFKIILVINKIDTLKNKGQIDNIIVNSLKEFHFDDIIPISALKETYLIQLKEKIIHFLEEGPAYYPHDFITDQSKERLISEFVREKIFFYCREEIPYNIATMIERIENINNKLLKIWVLILVNKPSHKKILIGKNGQNLKQIGIKARTEIQNFFNIKINLNLWVKIEPLWKNNPNLLKQLGYY